ncbi:WecB/TagA/CpsF family glycosyltransferase [Terrarubrum flagellatum]|uniref:WecB/TagA/CpsF family glycosyltransferase n=1 Tax=Terrirubrum flagellatum TaxID=2895980 RepID=UPI00314511A3
MADDSALARAGKLLLPRLVIASNGASIALFHKSVNFKELLLEADIIDADGMPLVIATRLFCRAPLPDRIATTDFIHDAAAVAVRDGLRFFFLGAEPGVAALAAKKIAQRHPGLQIVGVRHGYFKPEEEAQICEEIVASRADVLWVGLGTPMQERFAVANRHRLEGLAWIRTCGGLFDHSSGRFPRAPIWMQRAGFEWLHRAMLEPLRLGGRYLMTNPSAIYHLATKTHD